MEINHFVSADTPGNVGICLSGGGSRALSAGMGQLRALSHLKTPNGKSLLEQTKAISTVSGGSWIGTTFMYLSPEIDNHDYLNKYVENQSKLTPKAKPNSLPEEVLSLLPKNNIGQQVTKSFDMISIAMELIWLRFHYKVDISMLWQTIIGNHILKPYNLFPIDKSCVPTSTYTYSSTTKDEIVKDNPTLHSKEFSLVTNTLDPSKERPAFVICNAAMFVSVEGETMQYLAPVQSTPFFTGILGTPNGVDSNTKPAGGGGVTTFAFNSKVADVNHIDTTISQDRQWSLADIIGISSACFAEMLQNKIKEWKQTPSLFVDDFHESTISDAKLNAQYSSNNENIFEKLQDKISQDVEQAKQEADADFGKFLAKTIPDVKKKLSMLDELKNIIPQYSYWPVKNMSPDQNIKPTRFADAGNLENTGITALLSYADVDKIISFVNSPSRLEYSTFYFYDADNKPIENTNIIVDSQLPPLFGYQPYSIDNKGYLPYSGATRIVDPIFKYNQVFKAEMFPLFLQQLATKAGPNLNTNSAIVSMTLDVVDNSWYSIANRGTIHLVLVYTNRVRTWYNQLNNEVRQLLGDFNDPKSYSSFPQYSTTLKTQLTPEEINLLANLTAWTVANPDSSQQFIDLYC